MNANTDYDFYRLIIDSVEEHICVVDREGWIVFTNKAWNEFAEHNGTSAGKVAAASNYLQVCAQAKGAGDADIGKACDGIHKVISGQANAFSFEYPCHSADKQRWFIMRVTPLTLQRANYFVISHQDITQRKLAEDRNKMLARVDALTGLANRRSFDEQLMNEWRQCARQQQPIALALIDIDFFKSVNDSYGHAVGDYCLERVAALLDGLANRPGDCCARYGGDEFALLFSGASLEQAENILASLPARIRQLRIPNKSAATGPHVTVSIGLSALMPDTGADESLLLKAADHFLYRAKALGRDQLSCGVFSAAELHTPASAGNKRPAAEHKPTTHH